MEQEKTAVKKTANLVYCSYIYYFMDRFSSGASQRAVLWR